MTKRLSRVAKDGDPTAEAELRARSIAARLQRGLPLTKQQRSWWSDDVAAALLKLGGLLALATHHKILNRALSDNRLSAMALGQKSADAVLDRLLGKPTERVQVASKLTVHLGGLDPSRLPDARRAVDVTPKPPVPKPSLPLTHEKPDESHGGRSPPSSLLQVAVFIKPWRMARRRNPILDTPLAI